MPYMKEKEIKKEKPVKKTRRSKKKKKVDNTNLNLFVYNEVVFRLLLYVKSKL